MASVFKRKRDRQRKNASWFIAYQDERGKRRMVKGCPDKAATEQLARKLESEAELRRRGVIDPKADAYAAHEARPLADHISEWRADLIHRGDTAKHADLSTDRVRRLVAVMFGASPDEVDGKRMTRSQCDETRRRVAQKIAPARLSDLSAAKVQSGLARFRETGRSLETCNHYRRAVCGFARWCFKEGRLRDNPLLSVAGFNSKEDRRHDRRTVSLEELLRLIEAAERGPAYQAMTGPMRALCYRLAVATGLRYSEIATITPESFAWKAPSVRVAACYTKNGQIAELPLPNELAADLRPYVVSLNPRMPIFPLPGKGAKMLRVDLQAAGIPYQTASGFFDFHSLRCQTATLADAAGVSPRVVQRLMRHSTLELTGRYTRPRAVDIEAAASMIPSLKPEADRPGASALAATGTDSVMPDRPDLAAHWQRAGDGLGRNQSDSDATIEPNAPTVTMGSTPGKQGSGRIHPGPVGISREARPVGFEPTTFGFEVRDSIH